MKILKYEQNMEMTLFFMGKSGFWCSSHLKSIAKNFHSSNNFFTNFSIGNDFFVGNNFIFHLKKIIEEKYFASLLKKKIENRNE